MMNTERIKIGAEETKIKAHRLGECFVQMPHLCLAHHEQVGGDDQVQVDYRGDGTRRMVICGSGSGKLS